MREIWKNWGPTPSLERKKIIKGHRHLTGKLTELAHNECNLNTRKPHKLFVLVLFRNFSGYDSHIIFEKLLNMVTEKGIEIEEEDNIAKTSEI